MLSHFVLSLWLRQIQGGNEKKVKVKLLSCVPLFVTPWTATYQAPPSMGFSRQEYWSGVPLPSPHFYSLPCTSFTVSIFLLFSTKPFLNNLAQFSLFILVRAMVFPVVMYGYESWTIKKAEHQRTDAFELWCWRRLLRDPWTAKRSNHSILKEISPEYSLEGLMLKLKLKLQTFGHLMWRTDSLEKTLILG